VRNRRLSSAREFDATPGSGSFYEEVTRQVICGHPGLFGLPPQVRVLDSSDAADLLDLLRDELGLASQKLEQRRVHV
jgi:hypothetical protein